MYIYQYVYKYMIRTLLTYLQSKQVPVFERTVSNNDSDSYCGQMKNVFMLINILFTCEFSNNDVTRVFVPSLASPPGRFASNLVERELLYSHL